MPATVSISIDELVDAEKSCFNTAALTLGFIDFNSGHLDLFRQTLEHYGADRIQYWLNLGLEPHILPKAICETCDPSKPFLGKICPRRWCQEELQNGKIIRHTGPHNGTRVFSKVVGKAGIESDVVVLIDPRQKPDLNLGFQCFDDDECYLEPIVAALREQGKIVVGKHITIPLPLSLRKSVPFVFSVPSASRFWISPCEFYDHIRPLLAFHLGVEESQVDFETPFQAVAISQLFPHMSRANDGETNTSVWYRDCHGSICYQCFGGNSEYGGLTHVDKLISYDDETQFHRSDVGIRPIIQLSP